MILRLSLSIAIALSLVSAATAASPFAGKWKFNAAKSKLTGTSDSIAAAGPNTWKFTYGSYSWTIKADGTDQPNAFGGTVALKVASPTKWELTDKTNGKLTGTETWTLSADGKTMTRTTVGKYDDGTPSKNTAVVKRTAGDKGFEGTWESTDVNTSFTNVSIEANGTTGITLTFASDNLKVPLTFDGKESPESGPRVPAGMTTTTKVVSPNKLEVVTKLKGKALDSETWEVSADGKTFTYTELDAGTTKPSVIVLDKQ